MNSLLPSTPPDLHVNLRRARAFMDAHYCLPLRLDQIAGHANFSRYHFIRLFKQVYRQTPHQYLTRKRIERAKVLLRSEKVSVTEVCFAVGFESVGSFSTLFTRHVGHPPKVYRARLIERQRGQNAVPACFMIMLGVKPYSPYAQQVTEDDHDSQTVTRHDLCARSRQGA